MNTTIEQFLAAMRTAGIDYAGPLLADGDLHRFRAAEDHARNSWYVLHAGPPAAGAFGCWKRGIKETWCDDDTKQLTAAEREAVRRKIAECEQAREKEEIDRQQQAGKTAKWLVSRAGLATPQHPYLVKKCVQPYGELRERNGKLVLPLYDPAGAICSLQFIGADGAKLFLAGGRVDGCYFTINGSRRASSHLRRVRDGCKHS